MSYQEKQTLQFFIPHVPKKLNPEYHSCVSSQVLLRNITDRLTEMKPSGDISLNLLESTSVSLDGLTYRMTLHKDRYFHDGNRVTTDDIIHMLERVLKNPASSLQLSKYIEQKNRSQPWIRKISKHRFEIHLKKRFPDLLKYFTLIECSILQKDSGSFSGPWQIEEHSEDQIILKKAESHPYTRNTPYNKICIRTPKNHEIFPEHLEEDAYAFIYEGTRMRSITPSVVLGESIEDTASHICYYIKFLPSFNYPLDKKQIISAWLYKISKRAFRSDPSWAREPLDSLCPKNHKFYYPIPQPHKVAPITEKLTLRVAIHEGLIPDPLLIKLKSYTSSCNIDLQFYVNKERKSERELIKEGLHGVIKSFLFDDPNNIYSPTNFFLDMLEHKATLRDQLVQCRSTTNSSIQLSFFQNLSKNAINEGVFIPLFSSNIRVKSNRALKESARTLLHFDQFLESKKKIRDDKLREATLIAIGSAVQMFVHDIKKPFSMMQSILTLLESIQDPDKITKLIKEHIPSIKNSMISANGMIQDIVEIGSDSKPFFEPISIKNVIKQSLEEVFQLSYQADIDFVYDFDHEHKVSSDFFKILRVFSNIIANARQAMKDKGTIAFKTIEFCKNQKKWIQISITNTNSYIPPEQIEELFQLFFTKGKRRGTGLGLSIAKKIIENHGGEIWCKSSKNEGTTFFFTLSISEQDFDNNTFILPNHTAELLKISAKIDTNEDSPASSSSQEPLIISDLPENILIVDDEPIYLDLLEKLIQDIKKQYKQPKIFRASNSEEALRLMKKHQPGVIIIDVDLGSASLDGFSTVAKMREHDQSAKICIHSNTGLFHYQYKSLEMGADLFLPKPMSQGHLINILTTHKSEIKKVSKVQDKDRDPYIIVIDDDYIFLETWETLSTFRCLTFESPDEFWDELESNSSLANNSLAIITDYKFNNQKETNGIEFGTRIKEKSPNATLFLSTDNPLLKIPDNIFDKVISKDFNIGFKQLKQFLNLD